jgi:hypothetical protein
MTLLDHQRAEPNRTPLRCHRCPVCLIVIHCLVSDAQVLHGNALAVKHAEDVVIGNEEAASIRERPYFCEPARFGVPMRTDNG